MTAKTQTMHFTMSGEDFTRLARTRLLEDNPGSAWRIASCLDGDGVADAALRILRGDSRLEGDESGMTLVDDAPTEYLQQLKYVYAGRIQVHGKWYRPIAYVSDYGPNDMRNSHDKPVMARRDGPGYLNRAWHYCSSDEISIDGVGHFDGEVHGRVVIWERCNERPIWQTPPLTPQAALQEFLDGGRRLEERGHSTWYGEVGDWARDVKQSIDDARTQRELDPEVDEAQEKIEDAMRQETHVAQLAELRKRILAQAGDDLIELSWEDWFYDETDEAWNKGKAGTVRAPGATVMVPRAPFLRWAFARLHMFDDQLPPWTPVSPRGMKMINDDPNHTDWVIGAGLDPVGDYDLIYYPGPVGSAAMQLAAEMQDKFDRPAVHVLVDGPVARGNIVHGKRNQPVEPGSIVVLPNLRPHYVATVEHAAAVITEEGGATAHLAQIGRGRALPIVRIPNARKKFHPGDAVVVDTANRSVVGIGL